MAAAGGIILAEQEERHAIELFIDQQVFMDSVHGNEKVAELSAHTEVTTFEYRGNDLFLEGNILFTAYLETDSEENPSQSSVQSDDVQNLQHRMPFDVKVPVKFQPKGLLNVQVQIPDATLHVLGPGWTNIQAFLVIDGLSPAGGYVAHCGAQEAKVPLSVEPLSQKGESSSESAKVVSPFVADGEKQTIEKSFSLSDWLKPFEVSESLQTEQKVGEELSVRGSNESAQGSYHESDERQGESSDKKWKMDLQGADRALHGTPSVRQNSESNPEPINPFKTGKSSDVVKSNESELFEFNEEVRTDHASSIHFHFENSEVESKASVEHESHIQPIDAKAVRSELIPESPPAPLIAPVKPPTLTPQELAPATIPVAPPTPTQGEVAFSLEADVIAVDVEPEQVSGFHAGVSVQGATDGTAPLQMSYTAVPEENVEMTAAEWFWKTMNIPAGDAKCTMKFRIVHETETLEDISSLYHVSVSELMRVNDIAMEGSLAGMLLYIPEVQ